MYCNAACKKKHRHKHKKECERRVAELHDEKLFKQPPPKDDDCPICFLRLPLLGTGRIYMECCGKLICSGCIYAPIYDDKGNEVDNQKCPFCRTPPPTSAEENLKRLEKRMELNDARAIYNLGCYHSEGCNGFAQNRAKALELWHRAGELGCAESLNNIGYAYKSGEGVERDDKKAIYYWESAAMGGCIEARHNLGSVEDCAGNRDRALKHYMIAIREDGYSDSLKNIKRMYMEGHASKEVYTNALRSYQTYLVEIKSDQRDKAAAFNDGHKYYESAV